MGHGSAVGDQGGFGTFDQCLGVWGGAILGDGACGSGCTGVGRHLVQRLAWSAVIGGIAGHS